MKRSELRKLIKEMILLESIDLYSIDELPQKHIEYKIIQDSTRKFEVNLKYKNQYYSLVILPIFNPQRSTINFGDTNKDYENLNLNKLLNSSSSPRILASIFGLIRYWVDKYNIKEFEYGAEGEVRNKIYNLYLKKHFSDFENFQENFNGKIIQVWKRK